MAFGRQLRGVGIEEAKATPDLDALPAGIAPSSPPPAETIVAGDVAGVSDDLGIVDDFPYEIFEMSGGAMSPAEPWIDPYPGGTALSDQKPPTDLPIGAGRRRRGLTRSTK
jgi:hypothetical protein